ncbi:MAG: hypothetical protein Q6373_022515 [Candidatus Sigynarchaeota archaeon]
MMGGRGGCHRRNMAELGDPGFRPDGTFSSANEMLVEKESFLMKIIGMSTEV